MPLAAQPHGTPPDARHGRWSSRRLLLLVLLGGLLLRLGLLYATRDTPLQIVDERHYHQLAVQVLHGEGFAWHREALTSIRPPLYPAFIALLWALTGTESLVVIRLAHILLSLLNVYVLYRLGLHLFNARIALLAAASFWLYPSLVAFDFLLLTEVLFTLLLTLVALWYVQLLHTEKASMAWATGCTLGLAALARSILWLFPFVLCPLTLLLLRGPWRRRLHLALCLFLGYAVMVTPWAVRNTRLQGAFTVIDTMGGLNLMMGNYAHTPLYRAWDAVRLTGEKSWSYHLPPTAPDGSPWTEGRKDKWATQQALTYMGQHPGLTLKRAVMKFAHFWGLERVMIAGWQEGRYRPPLWGMVLGALAITIGYVATMLLASTGVVLGGPDDRRYHLFLLVLMAFICGLHTMVFGHERYHLPLIPLLLLYAAAAVVHRSWRRCREGWGLTVVLGGAYLGLLAVWGYEILVVEAQRLGGMLNMFLQRIL